MAGLHSCLTPPFTSDHPRIILWSSIANGRPSSILSNLPALFPENLDHSIDEIAIHATIATVKVHIPENDYVHRRVKITTNGLTNPEFTTNFQPIRYRSFTLHKTHELYRKHVSTSRHPPASPVARLLSFLVAIRDQSITHVLLMLDSIH